MEAKKLIVGNWKMNPATLKEAEELARRTDADSKRLKNVEVVVAPPFPFLTDVRRMAKNIKLAAQDVSWEEQGAFTGEVSPTMLLNLNVEYVIVGHSERRAMGEGDEVINKKCSAARRHGLNVILCVGESIDIRRKGFGAAKKFVEKQILEGLKGIEKGKDGNEGEVVIAYEPLWAVGTGTADSPDDAVIMICFIKSILDSILRTSHSRVLYGGSVTPENARGFLENGEIDGALIGRISLKFEAFGKILKILG
ncbi:MAG: triose-phosphate isomerase [Patescibacteria group bacterium]|nr:triose-phosphate isomerase [Patescibacteria group bacterium]